MGVVGGLAAGIAAASCCVVPFALFTLGVSGAWISRLTALEPYQPLFGGAALAFIGYGFYRAYLRPKPDCADGSYCAKPSSNRLTKVGLWGAVGLVALAFGIPRLAPFFL